MNADERFDRTLPELLHRLEGGGIPDYRDDIVRLTAGTRQRPAWTFPGRWFPMDLAIPRGPTVPFPRPILVLLLLALAAVATATLIAGALLWASRPAPPYGLASNGLIAYATDGDIFVLDPVDGAVRPIVTGPETDHGVLFALDGTRLLFFREMAGGRGERLMVANADGTDILAVTQDPFVDVGGYEWSGDGRRILVLSSVDGRQAMTIVDVASGARQVLPVEGDVDTADFVPPEGTLVAFTQVDPADPDLRAIGVMDVERDLGPRSITGLERGLSTPTLSPDGRSIAYSSAGPDGRLRVHVVGVDGSDDRTIDNPPAVVHQAGPRWSPDGTSLLVSRAYEAGGPRLATIRADGSDGPGDQAQPGREFENVWPTSVYQYAPDGAGILLYPGDEALEMDIWSPGRDRACPVDLVGCPLVLIGAQDEAIAVVPMPRSDDYSWQRRAP